jgi:quinol monooxygenase YgiN
MSTLRTTGTMTCAPADLPEVESIFRTFIAHVQANEPGVLTYHYFVDDGDPVVIHVIEEYADADVMIEHFANLPADVGRLLQLVQLGPMHFYGETTPALEETLAPFGSISYHRPLVSI